MMTGTKMQHIAYKGSTAAHPEPIAGQVQVMFDTVIATTQLIKSGRLRALSVRSKKRSAEFPEVPAIAESVPGYESTSWGVLIAPAKMPPAVIDRLNRESVRALNMPDVRERLARLGAEATGTTAAEARGFLHDEIAKWAKTVKAAGITPEN